MIMAVIMNNLSLYLKLFGEYF